MKPVLIKHKLQQMENVRSFFVLLELSLKIAFVLNVKRNIVLFVELIRNVLYVSVVKHQLMEVVLLLSSHAKVDNI